MPKQDTDQIHLFIANHNVTVVNVPFHPKSTREPSNYWEHSVSPGEKDVLGKRRFCRPSQRLKKLYFCPLLFRVQSSHFSTASKATRKMLTTMNCSDVLK